MVRPGRATAIAAIGALLLTTPLAARASDSCADAADQATMSQCAANSLMESDKALNDLYRLIKSRLKDDPETWGLLVQAQRDWNGFRDAECSFQTSAVAGGSIQPMLVAQCKDDLTRSRVRDFRTYLECAEGDLSCPVPPAG